MQQFAQQKNYRNDSIKFPGAFLTFRPLEGAPIKLFLLFNVQIVLITGI